MNKYSRFLSFAAILVCMTPLGGVYTLFQTFPWMQGHHNSANSFSHLEREHYQSIPRTGGEDNSNSTCAATQLLLELEESSIEDSMDAVRFDAGSFLDNPTPSTNWSDVNVTLQHQHRQIIQEAQPQLDPSMFHVRNNEFYNHFNSRNNHVLLLSWTLSLLLGLLVPVLALLYDAYLRITSKSRDQKQLAKIQKSLKPYKRKVLTKSQVKETCPICLSNFRMGESILTCGSNSSSNSENNMSSTSGCAHCFHQDCMVQWLFQQTKQTPILSRNAESTVSSLTRRRRQKLEAPCPCCRQPFVKVPLVR